MEEKRKEEIKRELEKESISTKNKLREIKELINWHQSEIMRLLEEKNRIENEYNSIFPYVSYMEIELEEYNYWQKK